MLPHIAVIIPTCNRPEDMRRCLESLSSVTYPEWDVSIIDQSDDGRTEELVNQFAGRLPHMAYRHLAQKGQTGARNAGIATTSSAIIAFLDDDCTVGPDWLHDVARAFERYPDAALVFGAVDAIPHDSQKQYVPSCQIPTEHTLRGRLAFRHLVGMGASMYLRRAAVEHVGLFDTCLGPGAYFQYGGDDRDYPYRCLVAGFPIVQTPHIAVLHFGARDFVDDGVGRLLLGYAYADGAVQMKFARKGDLTAIALIAWHCWDNLCGVNYRNLLLRRRPTHLNRLVMYLKGLLGSFQLKVNHRQSLYIARPSAFMDGAPANPID